MKQLNMFRLLDSRGRVTIPIEIRKVLKVETGEEVGFFIENDIICLIPQEREDVTQKQATAPAEGTDGGYKKGNENVLFF